MNARETAFLSLMKVENSGAYPNIELLSLERNGLSGAERALYTYTYIYYHPRPIRQSR